MRKFIVVVLVMLALSGCITNEYPDGRVETRIDLQAVELGLNTAIAAYNVYVSTAETQEPSRLTELLDNVDRALVLVNLVRDMQGKDPIAILKGEVITVE